MYDYTFHVGSNPTLSASGRFGLCFRLLSMKVTAFFHHSGSGRCIPEE